MSQRTNDWTACRYPTDSRDTRIESQRLFSHGRSWSWHSPNLKKLNRLQSAGDRRATRLVVVTNLAECSRDDVGCLWQHLADVLLSSTSTQSDLLAHAISGIISWLADREKKTPWRDTLGSITGSHWLSFSFSPCTLPLSLPPMSALSSRIPPLYRNWFTRHSRIDATVSLDVRMIGAHEKPATEASPSIGQRTFWSSRVRHNPTRQRYARDWRVRAV